MLIDTAEYKRGQQKRNAQQIIFSLYVYIIDMISKKDSENNLFKFLSSSSFVK